MTLKYSSVDTIFVPSDKKELRSRFLMKLDETDVHFSKGGQVKGGKECNFLEKPDIIDKYCRCDMEKNEELAELRPSQFAKMYEPISRRNPGKDKADENTDREEVETIVQRKTAEEEELEVNYNSEADDMDRNSESED